MAQQEEYHDPDYPGTSSCIKQEPTEESEEEKSEKIRKIIRREFTNELDVRENEIMLIDQRITTSRRLLHRLRYTLVSNYYEDQRLQLTGAQIQDEVAAQTEPRARNEVSAILRESQRRIHPSVRKLLGKKTADLDEILFRSREPRNKARKDYLAMIQTRNYTIPADATKSLRPNDPNVPSTDFADVVLHKEGPQTAGSSKPKKTPRQVDPLIVNIVTLDKAQRNQMKSRYRIIIGNTSKYAPAASLADRSTHKWLLYVRGPPAQPDLSRIVTAVSVRLHHSYAPHHTVHIDKPPFHVSRRGWGEFPARVELHFALPERNRPACVEHTIKLDRNYTGLQTLGAETIIDVWLYSTQEMLEYEFKENIEIDKLPQNIEPIVPKQEPITEEIETMQENWLDFFTNTTEMDVDEMIIKPDKKSTDDSIAQDDLAKVTNDLANNLAKDIVAKVANDLVKNANSFGKDTITVKEEKSEINQKLEDIPDQLLSQPTSPKKRIMKYMDPTTGKIYYLEMDRNLDLSKVQEIVINSKGNIQTAKISPIKSNGLKSVRKVKKQGISLLKPEVKSLLRSENNLKLKKSLTHIENDHCYLGSNWGNVSFQTEAKQTKTEEVVVKQEKCLYDSLVSDVSRITSIRVAVNYLLKKIPVICGEARDPDYLKWFPFAVDCEENYWKYDFAKRRHIEWSRAKLINKILSTHFCHEPVWRTKQILIYSRLHGFYPVRMDHILNTTHTNMDWSSWLDMESRPVETRIKELYPNHESLSTLSVFNPDDYKQDLSDTLELSDDEEVEIVKCDIPIVKKESVVKSGDLTVVPVENDEDRQRFLFVERKCADIGIELRNEDVGNGCSYSAVHAVLVSAMKSFAEELVRSALAERLREQRAGQTLPPVWVGSSSSRVSISLEHVLAATSNRRLRLLTNRDVAAKDKRPYAL